MPPVTTLQPIPSDIAGPSYQPFQCMICLKRFTRHENLKRHTALHTQAENGTSFPCDYCDLTFARADLKKRHQKNKHPQSLENGGQGGHSRDNSASVVQSMDTSNSPPEAIKQQQTMAQPISLPVNYDQSQWNFDMFNNGQDTMGNMSSSLNSNASIPNTYRSNANSSLSESFGQSSLHQNMLSIPQNNNSSGSWQNQATQNSSSRTTQQPPQASSYPPRLHRCSTCNSASPEDQSSTRFQLTPTQITRGVDLFFSTVIHFFPFLHRPTFDPSTTPEHLLLSICALGYQYGEDPDIDDNSRSAHGSGNRLSLKCYKVARELCTVNESKGSDSTHQLVIVQACLILQQHAMMYQAGDAGGSDGLRLHAKMIRISRSSGLMQPLPSNPNATSDLDSLWKEFIKGESFKRTVLALHHQDALWYQILSVPRSISHLEIKHDMPCQQSLWQVTSASEWAHKSLTASKSSPPIRYSEAVRRFLQLDSGQVMPQLELQGALNVIHFLQSSLREVSGFASMTSLVSLERFEALNASLSAIHPYITTRAGSCEHAWIVAEATYQIANIETMSWSASHMGGIVEVSLDAALATAAHLATSNSFIVDPEIARSLISHIDWFLLYLERTQNPSKEAPFVTVYAFKAFLVAWQLLRGIAPQAMRSVGIEDGDSESALNWAIDVFQKREKWMVGKLILKNLDSLSEMAGSEM